MTPNGLSVVHKAFIKPLHVGCFHFWQVAVLKFYDFKVGISSIRVLTVVEVEFRTTSPLLPCKSFQLLVIALRKH